MENIIEYDTIRSRTERMYNNTDIGAIRTFNLLRNGEIVETFNQSEIPQMGRDAGLDIRGTAPRRILEQVLPTIRSPRYVLIQNN